jgi:hypothetical protein
MEQEVAHWAHRAKPFGKPSTAQHLPECGNCARFHSRPSHQRKVEHAYTNDADYAKEKDIPSLMHHLPPATRTRPRLYYPTKLCDKRE